MGAGLGCQQGGSVQRRAALGWGGPLAPARCRRSARARGLAVVRHPCRTRPVSRPHPAAAAAAAAAPQARRPYLSREECELLDLQRQMEEEMVEEYKQVGRPPSLLVPPRGGA